MINRNINLLLIMINIKIFIGTTVACNCIMELNCRLNINHKFLTTDIMT